jgi:hypothetical protein
MSRQCPNCRKISMGATESCAGCGFSFEHLMGKRSFAETCFKIAVAITIVASVTAVIAKFI